MSKVKRTNHTVLAKVLSHRGGGAAKILSAHSAITDIYDGLTGKFFEEFETGTIVVVKVKLSGKRRLVQWVREDEKVWSVASFIKEYETGLLLEKEAYNRIHKSWGPEPTVSPAKGDGFDEMVAKSFTPEPLSKPEPEIDWTDRIYITPQDEKVLATLNKLSNKKHVAVMMIGPSGYGKTSIPQQKAKDWGMEFLRWDCATVRDPEEFFGFRGAVDGSTMTEDGETYFAQSEFTRIVEQGNAVIVLDELNRIDPYISNILFPLLDHAGRTSVAGHEVVVGPNILFFATVNLGFQFTGTFTLDTALTNRFAAKILVNALPGKIERQILHQRAGVNREMARQIVRLMKGLRGLNDKDQLSIDASTRVSIQIAELVGCGLELKEALVYVVINGISDEEAKLVIDQLGFVS